MSRRLGILGGTFDPIHVGHLDLATAAAAQLQLTSLLVMPSHVPPHRPPPVASCFHRFAMASMAVAGRSGWLASDLELNEPAHSYTSDTLRRLHRLGYQPSELFFVTGADAFAEIRSWKDYPQLLDLAHFAVISRPGLPVDALVTRFDDLRPRIATGGTPVLTPTSVTFIDAATTDVSATRIRARLAAGDPIDGMVAESVRQHIEQHGLYTTASATQTEHAGSNAASAGRLHGQE